MDDHVAVCKMSNVEYVDDGWYVYVSLTTVYIHVGVPADKKDYVRNSFEPTHLLNNFKIPIFYDGKIDKNDEEKVDTDSSQVEEEMDDDKKNKNMKDNKKPVEEKMKEFTAKTKTLYASLSSC